MISLKLQFQEMLSRWFGGLAAGRDRAGFEARREAAAWGGRGRRRDSAGQASEALYQAMGWGGDDGQSWKWNLESRDDDGRDWTS